MQRRIPGTKSAGSGFAISGWHRRGLILSIWFCVVAMHNLAVPAATDAEEEGPMFGGPTSGWALVKIKHGKPDARAGEFYPITGPPPSERIPRDSNGSWVGVFQVVAWVQLPVRNGQSEEGEIIKRRFPPRKTNLPPAVQARMIRGELYLTEVVSFKGELWSGEILFIDTANQKAASRTEVTGLHDAIKVREVAPLTAKAKAFARVVRTCRQPSLMLVLEAERILDAQERDDEDQIDVGLALLHILGNGKTPGYVCGYALNQLQRVDPMDRGALEAWRTEACQTILKEVKSRYLAPADRTSTDLDRLYRYLLTLRRFLPAEQGRAQLRGAGALICLKKLGAQAAAKRINAKGHQALLLKAIERLTGELYGLVVAKETSDEPLSPDAVPGSTTRPAQRTQDSGGT